MTSFWYYYVFIKSLFDTYCTIPILADVPKSEVRELDHCLFTKRPGKLCNELKTTSVTYRCYKLHGCLSKNNNKIVSCKI